MDKWYLEILRRSLERQVPIEGPLDFVNTQPLRVHKHFVQTVLLRAFADLILFERKAQ